MEKNINIVFAQEDSTVNVLEVSYVQPEFSNDHPAIYELKMIEKILEGEYFEDFVNLNLQDFVKRKINQDKNFGSPVTDVGMFSAEATDFRERTYLINVLATGENFEFGVYDSGDEWEDYKLHSLESFAEKYKIKTKIKKELKNSNIVNSIEGTLIGKVAEAFHSSMYLEEVQYDGTRKLPKKEYDDLLYGYLTQRLEEFKKEKNVKNEDELYKAIEETKPEEDIYLKNASDVIIKMSSGNQIEVEASGILDIFAEEDFESFDMFIANNEKGIRLKINSANYRNEDYMYIDSRTENFVEYLKETRDLVNMLKKKTEEKPIQSKRQTFKR